MSITSVLFNTFIILLTDAAFMVDPAVFISVSGAGTTWLFPVQTVPGVANWFPQHQQQLIIGNTRPTWQNIQFPSVVQRGNLFFKLMPYTERNPFIHGTSRGTMNIPFPVRLINGNNVVTTGISNNPNNLPKLDETNKNITVDDLVSDSSKNNQNSSVRGGSKNDKRPPLDPELNRGLSWSNSSRISEAKCEEYSRRMGRTVLALPLVGIGHEVLSASLGDSKCAGISNPLIVSGTTAEAGEFPHMAALGWTSADGKVRYLCGGTLISEQWVITAAHCTHGHSGSPTLVRIGAHRLSDEKSGQLIEIKSILRHPEYRPPAMYADIALLKLQTPITFGADIRPACLYTKHDVVSSPVWATGWGATGVDEKRSDELLKARLEVVDNVICALWHNRSRAVPRGIVPNMVCAGDVNGGWREDTCQGDSGGPLQAVHPTDKCLYQLIGVTSFGKLCAFPKLPGVYTRVSYYLDWIERIVWPEGTL